VNPSGISVAELRSALNQFFDDVEDRLGLELAFPEDFYWNVPFNEATNVEGDPSPDMGSLVDDVASVRAYLARDRGDVTSIWHEADHIAGVLRGIARLDTAAR